MATSGYIEKVLATAYGRVVFKLSWQRTGYSAENNSSTIQWTYEIVSPRSGDGHPYNYYEVNINGTVYQDNFTARLEVGSNIVQTGTLTIPHNADGTKSFSYSFRQSRGSHSSILTVSGTDTLDPITRPATILTAPNFTDEENPTITYSNPDGESVTELMACISLTGAKDDVVYRAISKTGTSYTFNLTDAERATLRKGISSSSSRTVLFMIRTRIEGQTYWSNLTKTLTLINHTPTLSPTIKDVNSRTISLTGDANKLVKYHSNAQVTFGAAARKEAEIVSRRVVCGSQTIEVEDRGQDTVTINGVDSNTFYLQAIDSRNIYVNSAPTKTLIEYVKLTNNIKPGVLTANGTLPITVSGKYFNGSFGAKSNTMEIEYAIKDSSGTFITNPNGGGWQPLGTVTPSVDGEYNYTYSFTASGLDYTKTYTVMVNVIDELTPVQTSSKVVAATPVFDWGKDDFSFNVPIEVCDKARITKEGQLHGTTLEGITIQAIDPCNNNNNLVIGYGNYGWDTLKTPDGQPAGTNIYGGIIRLNSRSGILINGREYGSNKVLWNGGSTGSHMNAEQTANLSEAISAQPNGIVLVFSAYETATGYALNVSWTTHFVPKYMVNSYGGGGQSFLLMNNAGFGVMGAKYLYISDTQIKGHSGNTQTGTNSGITFRNNEYVLRYVIGV